MAKTRDPKPAETPPMTIKELAALGGTARARSLTAERRQEIAQQAGQARWAKKKPVKKNPGKGKEEKSK